MLALVLAIVVGVMIGTQMREGRRRGEQTGERTALPGRAGRSTASVTRVAGGTGSAERSLPTS